MRTPILAALVFAALSEMGWDSDIGHGGATVG